MIGPAAGWQMNVEFVLRTLYVRTANFYVIRCWTGNQCSWYSNGLALDRLDVWSTIRVVALCCPVHNLRTEVIEVRIWCTNFSWQYHFEIRRLKANVTRSRVEFWTPHKHITYTANALTWLTSNHISFNLCQPASPTLYSTNTSFKVHF